MAKFRAIIGIPRGETANAKKVCMDIQKRNPSFTYEIFEPTIPEIKKKFESLLLLDSYSRNDANRWAGWFIHRCKNAKLSNYFWVKEI